MRAQFGARKNCHCERSEAISALKCGDCFVVSLLAMTVPQLTRMGVSIWLSLVQLG